MMKNGSFVKIVKPDTQWNGKTGVVIGRTGDGTHLIISIDLDGDPTTPPIEVKIEKKYARAFRVINWFVSFLLPLFYGIRRR
jgi:ribosomal protein L21E